MVKIPPENLYQEIRNTDIAEDYEFDDTTIKEINDLLVAFLNQQACEAVFREHANSPAKRQAKHLRMALEHCLKEIHDALDNLYVSAHLSDQYRQQLLEKENDNEEIAYDTGERWAALFEQLEVFAAAAKAVDGLPSLETAGFPTFSVGRGNSRDNLKSLVGKLYAIAHRHLPKDARQEARFEIIQELLSLVLDNPPSLKTLHNMLSELRSQK